MKGILAVFLAISVTFSTAASAQAEARAGIFDPITNSKCIAKQFGGPSREAQLLACYKCCVASYPYTPTPEHPYEPPEINESRAACQMSCRAHYGPKNAAANAQASSSADPLMEYLAGK
jgi:hypothetical protein